MPIPISGFFSSGWEEVYYEKIEIPWIPCKTLILHWAWQGDSSRTTALRNSLFQQGIPTLAIDFSGHGKSTKHNPLSIRKRINEARHAISLLDKNIDITLIGFSMSGEVSIRLSHQCSVRNIFLFAPWIYHSEAIDMPFWESFSEIIRMHESWRKNDIENMLKDFQGNLLLFTPEFDTVIPPWVNDIIMDAVRHTESEKITIKNAPHMVGKWMNENPQRVPEITQKIKQYYTQ